MGSRLQRTSIDLSDERRILSQMIVSQEFLSQMRGIANARFFESSFARTVATWTWEFYEMTQDAPGRAMEDIFLRKGKEVREEETTSMIASFLSNLSDDWEKAEPNNIDYSVKMATEWFQYRSIVMLSKKLESAIKSKDPNTAEKVIGDFKKVERAMSDRVDILEDADTIATAFSQEEEALFTLPGALGLVVGPVIRGDFIGIVAPPKRGKTWMADYFGQRGGLVGLKTLFVSLEMTKNQITRRRWQSLLGAKKNSSQKISMPYFSGREGDGDREIYLEPYDAPVVNSDTDAIKREQGRMKTSLRTAVMHMEIQPSGQYTPGQLRSQLQNAASYEDLVYDVIVIDSPYLMGDDNDNKEERHRLNSINMALRGIAQEFNVAMVVTHQGDATTMEGKKDVKAFNTAEAKIGTVSHYTKMIGLNQTEQEKANGVMRISCDITRDGAGTSGQAVVLQALGIGRPYLDSELKRNVNLNTLAEV